MNSFGLIRLAANKSYPVFEVLLLLLLAEDVGLLIALGTLKFPGVPMLRSEIVLRLSLLLSTWYWPGPGVLSLFSENLFSLNESETPPPEPFPLIILGSYLFGPGVSESFSLNLFIGALENMFSVK